MNDTVKIQRPMECRRHENLGGRVKHDSEGNTLKVRTRAEDSQNDGAALLLERTVTLEKDSVTNDYLAPERVIAARAQR